MAKNPQKHITAQDLYPDLSPEDQEGAIRNLRAYVGVVKRMHDRLKAEGKWDEVKLRIDYDKRNRNKSASQNVGNENDDTLTPNRDSNQFVS